MKSLRGLPAVAALALALALPGSAFAAINKYEIGSSAKLGPEGASLTVPVTVNCDEGDGGFLTVTVSQTTGHRLAQGSGSSMVTCTGSDQTLAVAVGNFPGVNAYKKGRASASGTIDTFSMNGSDTATAGPQPIQLER
jgi:hypothetical protein